MRTVHEKRKMPGTVCKLVDADIRISVSVSMQIGRNEDSTCSATAINALMTGSDSGTRPEEQPTGSASLRIVPTSTMVRISLMTCSFSTVYLLSLVKDL